MKVLLLKKLVQQTGAEIVLSSSWRTMLNNKLEPMEQGAKNLLAILSSHGLSLYSKTECLKEKRPKEIRLWLSQHEDVEDFVILDDDAAFDWEDLKSHWVKTSYYVGLTEKEVENATLLLNPV